MDKEQHNPVDPEVEMVPDAEEQGPQITDDFVEVDDAEGSEIEALKNDLEKQKSAYLFLMADFDNYKKRSLKEKSELIRNGAESAMRGLLPILDDFERGLDAIKGSSDAESVKEGMTLIYNKFVKYLEQNGVKAMESTGADFDDNLHEAVALVPGPEEQRGKVIDTMQKGYMLNDKVLRHAKVAVGQ